MDRNIDTIKNILNKSYDLALEQSSKYILLEHLLYITLKVPFIKKYLMSVDKNNYFNLYKKVKKFLDEFPLIEKLKDKDDTVEISKSVTVLLYQYFLCIKCNKDYIKNEDLLILLNLWSSFIFMKDTHTEKMLRTSVFNEDFITNLYQKEAVNSIISDKIKPFIDNQIDNSKNIDKQEQSFLELFTIDLTSKVGKPDWIPIVGRTEEMELLEQILYRRDKPNAILVGNPGIGKTKIVEGLAWKYREINPDITFLQLDTLSLMSNVFMKGEIENRIKNLCSIIKKRNNIVLFIDEIHTICNNNDTSNQTDVANLLKPLMTDNSLKIIGATTFSEYRKYIEKDEAFTRRFYKMVINDPTIEETKNILFNIMPKYAEFYNIEYTDDAMNSIIELSNKYIFDKHFPDKAIDVMDMAGAYCKYLKENIADVNHIQRTISKMLKIPLSNISQSEEDIYQSLEEKIKEKIIGQDDAVKQLTDAVIIARSGLRETNKTASSLMFKGGSGVGKCLGYNQEITVRIPNELNDIINKYIKVELE